MNIFHVLDLRKNLVFASLLCKKGFKAIIEFDHVILSKKGLFVSKGYNCEGIFKLNLDEINKVKASFAYIVDSFSLWHAKLAHLSFNSYTTYIYKHGYISFRYNNGNDKYEIYIQAKIIEKYFPKIERSTLILDLVHYDICELNEVLTRGGK